MGTVTRATLVVALGAATLASVSCTKAGTITEVQSASTTTKAGDSSTTAKEPSATSTASTSGPSTSSKRPAADAGKIIDAGLLQADDVGSGWTALDDPTKPSRPEPGERPVDCPFTNDFYEGAVLGATSAEFQNGDEKIYDAVVVFEDEAAAKAAMKVRQRDQDEECTKTSLEKAFESQGNQVVNFSQAVVTGPGYADEEVYTSFDFQLLKAGVPLAGGTLYAASRVGRVVVIINYKNTAGPVGDMPTFMADPIERLRGAGAG